MKKKLLDFIKKLFGVQPPPQPRSGAPIIRGTYTPPQ